MSTRQTVLRDFSELKPIEKRIELLAQGIYQIAFKGEANEDFRPMRGTQVERVWKMMKLNERQQVAWREFMDDVLLAAGKSGAVTGGYGEYQDKPNDGEFRAPVAYVNVHYRRVERLMDQCLTRSERALLVELLQDSLKGNSSVQLETIGLIQSGYSDKVSARAAGVVHVQNLLNRIAAYYGI
jgi:hypothetical protein